MDVEEKKKACFCRNCGLKHPLGDCPAFGKRCLRCRAYNHFAKVCFTKKQKCSTDDDSLSATSSTASSDATLPEPTLAVVPPFVPLPTEKLLNYERPQIQQSAGAIPKNSKCCNFCTSIHDEQFRLACGHVLYRKCLVKSIFESDETPVKCPAVNDCAVVLTELVIKKIMSPKEYTLYLSNEKSFRCRNAGCNGWFIYQSGKEPRFFFCIVCQQVNCLMCKSIHQTGPCKIYENILNYYEDNTGTLKKTKDIQLKIYPILLDLAHVELVPCPENFQCLICFEDKKKMEGIYLKECLHAFCRVCLRETIFNSETPEIKCPYADNKYSCPSFILEQEIRSLLSEREYERRLEKTLSAAEKVLQTFHCKTPNCRGWCEIEDDAEEFECPICHQISCIICSVIHRGMTCEQYQRSKFNNLTEQQVADMIRMGRAMRCPRCGVLISKIDGCDGMTCASCRLDICWVTKKPRWGPGGKGDWSGGCRCKMNGILCHPACQNCH